MFRHNKKVINMFSKLVRIGRDAELKHLPTGTAVLEVSVVYDVGFGDKKVAQWVKLAMFGARAEKLVGHFTKGKQIVAYMSDVKAEAWIKDGEAKCAIKAQLSDFDFVSDGSGGQQASPQQPAPAQQAAPQMAPAYQPAPQQAVPVPQKQSWGNAPAQQPQCRTAPAPQQAPVPQNTVVHASQAAQQQAAPAQAQQQALQVDDLSDIPF